MSAQVVTMAATGDGALAESTEDGVNPNRVGLVATNWNRLVRSAGMNRTPAVVRYDHLVLP